MLEADQLEHGPDARRQLYEYEGQDDTYIAAYLHIRS